MAEDPQNTFLKSISDFEYFLALRPKKKYFFQKAETFLHTVTSWYIFFDIHNPKKKWLEISIFENSIIRWVYKIVKEALKKSDKIHVVFF